MAISFDYSTERITLTSPHTTELLMQDLINEIRDIEDSDEGMQYAKIANAEGKVDIGGGVVGDITVTLLNGWQIYHTAGSYQAVLKGGQVVGGLGDNPIAYVSGVNVKQIQSVTGTISVISTGSGLSTEEQAQLQEMWQLMGLDESNPVTTTTEEVDVDTIHQDITGDGTTTSTITRND